MKIQALIMVSYVFIKDHPGVSELKNPPAKEEIEVRSLGWEDPLKKGAVTHASILDWEIPQRSLEDHGPWGCKSLW